MAKSRCTPPNFSIILRYIVGTPINNVAGEFSFSTGQNIDDVSGENSSHITILSNPQSVQYERKTEAMDMEKR